MQHRWQDDQHLLDDLADAVRAAAPDAAFVEIGKGAFAWRTIDQDLLLASVSFDSSLQPAQERGSDEDNARVLAFAAPPLSLELEVTPDRIVGQIVPPGPGQIRVETVGGVTIRAEADDIGFFELSRTLRGPVRLYCDTQAARLVTEWVHL